MSLQNKAVLQIDSRLLCTFDTGWQLFNTETFKSVVDSDLYDMRKIIPKKHHSEVYCVSTFCLVVSLEIQHCYIQEYYKLYM